MSWNGKMKERIKAIVIIAIIIILFQIFINLKVGAKNIILKNSNYDIIVDIKGFGDYKSIQQAIDIAKPGSSIYIMSGEYYEIINIKKLLYLEGENKDTTIINPISEENKYAIRMGAPEINISSLTIINGAPGLYSTAIKVCASNTKIYDCNIYNTPVGISIWTSGNLIDNCVFKGCKDEGIALLGSKNSKCSDNIIKNSIFYDNCDGIELQYSCKNMIENCEIYDNTHSGIDAIAKLNDENIITKCDIYNNRVHGIYLSASSENQIIDCKIKNNKDGDIIMNKYSKNNQIINTEDDGKDIYKTVSLSSFINRLYDNVNKLKESRIISIFNNLNF